MLEKEKFLKITTAFSRDQKEKIYVQHRLLENKKELWNLINNNTYIYLCGNAKKIAKEIDSVFLQIFQENGLNAEEAQNFLNDLLFEKRRYLKDVY